MSVRRAAWICAELAAEAERRLGAAGCEPDREVLHRAFWPQAKRLAAAQKWLRQTASWYELALADAEQAALACVAAIDAVAPSPEQPACERAEGLGELDPVAWAEQAIREAA